MGNNIIFGTYNVSNDGMTISYNAPSILPKETMDKISFQESREKTDDQKIEIKQPVTQEKNN